MRDGVDIFDANGDRCFYVAPEDTHEVNGGIIIECLSPEQKANTKHIIDCVNAHDALLAQLRLTIMRLARVDGGDSTVISNAVDAIKAATGEDFDFEAAIAAEDKAAR